MRHFSDHHVKLFRALGHPIRAGIVERLSREPETCACDFTEFFNVSQPTISEHLRTLRDAGLVVTRRQGTQICYSLNDDVLADLEALLADLRRQHEASRRAAAA